MIQNAIRELFAAGDIEGIIHQVDILMEDRARVRAENDGYRHEIRRLAQAFANITEPHTGRPIVEGTTKKTPNPSPTPKSKTSPKASKDTLDLDL